MNDKPENLPRLPHRSLRAAAYAAIRAAILSGQLKPGQRLFEAELAEQLGVSRAPVREALRQLVSEDLVRSEPHRGTHVTDLSPHDMWEVYTLRAAVEGLAVSLVAGSSEPEVAERLAIILSGMRAAAEQGQWAKLSELDMHFHETICSATGHRRLLEVWNCMHAQIRMFVAMTDEHDTLPPDERIRCHEVVLEAIRRGNPTQAEELLKDHILTVGKRIVVKLEQMERAQELVGRE